MFCLMNWQVTVTYGVESFYYKLKYSLKKRQINTLSAKLIEFSVRTNSENGLEMIRV